jgi:phage-related protein
MTATSFLELKQSLTRVSETERRELSAFLIRRGQERPAWKKETARRLAAMAAGQQVSVAALRSQLGHG